MIEVNNLKFSYPGSNLLTVKGINFSIAQGEIFGFLGPSGAGKSTTQKILIKTLKEFDGKVEIMGKDLSKWGNEFFNHIGVGFELPNHYNKLTALENLQFFAAFYDVKTKNPIELLEMVGLEDDANKKLESYSKGMKMRLNFIRALQHDPDIYFFDEPTSGLDPVNARKLKNIIKSLKASGKTIFITTHNMHDADELCDRVSFIVDGKLVVTESPKQLKLSNGKRKLKLEYGANPTQFTEFSMDKLGNNSDFLKIINNEKIVSIHSEEASLEDIFIKTTGIELS